MQRTPHSWERTLPLAVEIVTVSQHPCTLLFSYIDTIYDGPPQILYVLGATG